MISSLAPVSISSMRDKCRNGGDEGNSCHTEVKSPASAPRQQARSAVMYAEVQPEPASTQAIQEMPASDSIQHEVDTYEKKKFPCPTRQSFSLRADSCRLPCGMGMKPQAGPQCRLEAHLPNMCL